MNGPIAVAGAEPGDALLVEILDMVPIAPTGWTRPMLAVNVVDPIFARDVLQPGERTFWTIERNARTSRLAEPPAPLKDFDLPLEPMIGCFGVAPELGQAISTATSAEHGGNMDYRRFGPGTKVAFPVAVPGALFFLGDCHAAQGDGEIVGTGIEGLGDDGVTAFDSKRDRVAAQRVVPGGGNEVVGWHESASCHLAYSATPSPAAPGLQFQCSSLGSRSRISGPGLKPSLA